MLPYFRGEIRDHSKKYVIQFRGLNLGENYTEGEFSDCVNISSALAPCITQRSGRALEALFSAPNSLHAKGELLVIDGTDVIYGGNKVGTVSEGRKQIVTVGRFIIIFPDKVYYNTEVREGEVAFGSMNESYTAAAGKAVFTDETITVAGAAWRFRIGDAVEISGCTKYPENNKTIIVRGVDGDVLTFYDNSFTAGTETAAVSLKREVPDLDFICESNYRLWGVHGDTIYGSKYNDPFNFQVFDGLSGDSYNINVGSDGEWTGCAAYSSHICFFKEHTLHKLYGSKPSNYQVMTSQVFGVQAGSERSICTINEMLIYKGVNGVYAYSGGIPELISENFGTVRFSDACAASDGDRYYISMRRGEKWVMYVYDTLRGVWLAEDGEECVDMAFHGGHLYFLCADGRLLRTDESLDRSDIEWSATFCPFNETMNERKGYSKFHLRMEMAAGSSVFVDIKRDKEAKWQRIFRTKNSKNRTVSIPVIPARCDSVEIRLSGRGECLIRTFVREFFTGSDV